MFYVARVCLLKRRGSKDEENRAAPLAERAGDSLKSHAVTDLQTASPSSKRLSSWLWECKAAKVFVFALRDLHVGESVLWYFFLMQMASRTHSLSFLLSSILSPQIMFSSRLLFGRFLFYFYFFPYLVWNMQMSSSQKASNISFLHYSNAESPQRWSAIPHRVSRHGAADGARSTQLHTHRPQLHEAGIRCPRSPLQQPEPHTDRDPCTDAGPRAADCTDATPAANENHQCAR